MRTATCASQRASGRCSCTASPATWLSTHGALPTWKPICDVVFCPYGLGHKKMTLRLFTVFCQQFVEKIRVAYGQIRPPASKKWPYGKNDPNTGSVQKKTAIRLSRQENNTSCHLPCGRTLVRCLDHSQLRHHRSIEKT